MSLELGCILSELGCFSADLRGLAGEHRWVPSPVLVRMTSSRVGAAIVSVLAVCVCVYACVAHLAWGEADSVGPTLSPPPSPFPRSPLVLAPPLPCPSLSRSTSALPLPVPAHAYRDAQCLGKRTASGAREKDERGREEERGGEEGTGEGRGERGGGSREQHARCHFALPRTLPPLPALSPFHSKQHSPTHPHSPTHHPAPSTTPSLHSYSSVM